MSTLALLGGDPSLGQAFPRFNTYGHEEVQAATEVLKTGMLSGFIGADCPQFYGGERIQSLEKKWMHYFSTDHAISVNSATSGLICALGAIKLEPGDEVIVSTWSMCASATAILVWNGIPVFADIDENNFNIDPCSIEKNITEYTKAIVVPDIFGQSADLDKIMAIAKKHKLYVIEDAAQSPGAKIGDKYVGTIADIGIFSLNCHKHIHTGEGGICVTNNEILAENMRLIRNHAEAVVGQRETEDYANMMGFNFRLGEVEAAIAEVQLDKLKNIIDRRVELARMMDHEIKQINGLRSPEGMPGSSHVYYIYPMILDTEKVNVPRNIIIKALEAEGVPGLMSGYLNIHMLPMYQKRVCYGANHFPWHSSIYKGDVSYNKGICPIAEQLQDNSFIGLQICMFDFSDKDISDIGKAFSKVWKHMGELHEYSVSCKS